MNRVLSILAAVLFFTLPSVIAQAQAAPVPAIAGFTLTDTSNNPITIAPTAPMPCSVNLTLTNTQPVDTAPLSPVGSFLLTTPGTNADKSAGTRTSPFSFPPDLGANYDISNATVTLTVPTVKDASGNLIPILVPTLPMPTGWTPVSGTVFLYTQPLLVGGATVKASFPGTLNKY